MIKKNERMNPESIKSLKEFNKKQIQSNIKLHKIFLSMIIIIIIFLIGFIIIYKSKISEIKSKMEIHSSKIKENEKYISSLNNMYSHKLVNIFAISINIFGNYHFSLIFDTSEEVKNTKNFISSFTKIEDPFIELIYQGTYDGDKVEKIMFLIRYLSHVLIIVETKNKEKFGFFSPMIKLIMKKKRNMNILILKVIIAFFFHWTIMKNIIVIAKENLLLKLMIWVSFLLGMKI